MQKIFTPALITRKSEKCKKLGVILAATGFAYDEKKWFSELLLQVEFLGFFSSFTKQDVMMVYIEMMVNTPLANQVKIKILSLERK